MPPCLRMCFGLGARLRAPRPAPQFGAAPGLGCGGHREDEGLAPARSPRLRVSLGMLQSREAFWGTQEGALDPCGAQERP